MLFIRRGVNLRETQLLALSWSSSFHAFIFFLWHVFGAYPRVWIGHVRSSRSTYLIVVRRIFRWLDDLWHLLIMLAQRSPKQWSSFDGFRFWLAAKVHRHNNSNFWICRDKSRPECFAKVQKSLKFRCARVISYMRIMSSASMLLGMGCFGLQSTQYFSLTHVN